MLKRSFNCSLLSVGIALCGAGINSVYAQSYPTKPVRIVTSAVGGSLDFVSRLIAQGIAGPLGQPAIVDNRAGTIVGVDLLLKAPPDGYNLLVVGSNFMVAPLMQTMPYDPVADFAPVSLVATAPTILVVHPSLPVRTVRELIALAKANPAKLNYASSAVGGTSHLAAELLNSMSGINLVRINYKGIAPALTGLIGGEVYVTFAAVESATPHMRSGRLRALAVTSAQPSALVPRLPTVAASGLPGFEAIVLDAVFVRAKTPAAIIERLNYEIRQVAAKADVRQKLMAAGLEPVASSPQELATLTSSEIKRWGKVIKDAGITVQ